MKVIGIKECDSYKHSSFTYTHCRDGTMLNYVGQNKILKLRVEYIWLNKIEGPVYDATECIYILR